MRVALRFTCAILFSMMFGIGSGHCLAQQANCETDLYFKGSAEIKLPSLIQVFAQEHGTSVLAEVPYDLRGVPIPPGSYSFDRLVKSFDPALHCEAVEGVLHVFEDSALSNTANALNYRFAFFEMPPNVDRFRIVLKERLVKEAFAPSKNDKTVIQESGGGTSWDADRYPLQEKTYRNVKARDLLFAVARKYPLSSVVCFPARSKTSTDLETWKFAAAHWDWVVSEKPAVAAR